MVRHTAGGETVTVDLPAEWDGEVAFAVLLDSDNQVTILDE